MTDGNIISAQPIEEKKKVSKPHVVKKGSRKKLEDLMIVPVPGEKQGWSFEKIIGLVGVIAVSIICIIFIYFAKVNESKRMLNTCINESVTLLGEIHKNELQSVSKQVMDNREWELRISIRKTMLDNYGIDIFEDWEKDKYKKYLNSLTNT
jgi:hypothetical protein